ncbi:MAG TPA: hypothetical protein VK083_08525 [Nocardia sp.]|uniref:hypothetical protein n=1 Tax=Nocardia sp. TaxID=1821 RepID=UPI002B4ACBE7|nr:hypothetical protein [Nocardia sp.]HLS76816.1 hypothetical protein [Nocardia sp.]
MSPSSTHEPRPSAHQHRPDAFAEFAEELRLLAEAVLERVEPVLRGAAEDRAEWSSCSWCPVCATAALVRGEHHDVLTALADHGTAIVTVLREALAGAPVEPVLPEDEPGAGDQPGADGARPAGPNTGAASAAPRADGAVPTGHPDGGPAAGRTASAAHARGGVGEPSRSSRRATGSHRRSGYTDIPVTIRT